MHFSTKKKCKTTFCTHYEGMSGEEKGTGTSLSDVLPNRDCVGNISKKKRNKNNQSVLLHKWDKITPDTLHPLVSSIPQSLLL